MPTSVETLLMRRKGWLRCVFWGQVRTAEAEGEAAVACRVEVSAKQAAVWEESAAAIQSLLQGQELAAASVAQQAARVRALA